MATTTVRLDPDEERTLDQLAAIHGGRSKALREGLRLLDAATRQRTVLTELLREWEDEAGPADEAAVHVAIERYGL